MLLILRFLGVVNAAIWLGASVGISLVVLPAFFAPSVTPELIPKYHAGRIAELVLGRYLILQLVCGGIAMVHLVGEWLYSGRPAARASAAVLVGLLGLSMAGTFWLSPKLERLHKSKYAVNYTPAQKESASREFGRWHGVSQAVNLAMLAGILFHFWTIVNLPGPIRFAGASKRAT